MLYLPLELVETIQTTQSDDSKAKLQVRRKGAHLTHSALTNIPLHLYHALDSTFFMTWLHEKLGQEQDVNIATIVVHIGRAFHTVLRTRALPQQRQQQQQHKPTCVLAKCLRDVGEIHKKSVVVVVGVPIIVAVVVVIVGQ